jgi:hypothetical protein
MFFHIENAFHMAVREKSDFDLFTRLRPDLEYFEPSHGTWAETFDQAHQEGSFFTDSNFKICDPYGLLVGDQFALGQKQPMEHYCTIFPKLRATQKEYAITLDGGPRPHSTFGYHLAAGGILPVSLQPDPPLSLLDAKPVLPCDIAKALACDIPPERRASDPLWRAIQTDLRESAS